MIRECHLNWPQEKITVRLAVKTLSQSNADAIRWLDFDEKMSEFEGASATATFCENINNVFDILNSIRCHLNTHIH